MATKKYNCSVDVEINIGFNNSTLELCPEDYLVYDSEEEVEDAIKEDLDSTLNYGDVIVDDFWINYNIPKEFFIKWNELKHRKK